MKKAFVSYLLMLLVLALSACSTVKAAEPASMAPTAVQAATENTFTDPFAYCGTVGTVDTPDARYIGDPVPVSVINGFKKAADLEASTMPVAMFKKTTIWRCMDHQVYACNFGANLPCDSKAKTDKTPTQAMRDFCKANQNAEVIPASVTGHDTIFTWRCVKDTPELLNQADTVDAAGYLSRIWYAIQANP